MSDEDKLYSIEELSGVDEQQLLDILKRSWGYPTEKPIHILGRLREIRSTTSSFFILEEIRSTKDGRTLIYPISGESIKNNVFVGSIKSDLYGIEWIKTQVTLSPQKERKKRNNPFQLKAVSNSIEALKAIPDTITNQYYYMDGNVQIENWIVDFYRSKNESAIEKERKQLLDSFEKDRSRTEQEREELFKLLQKDRSRAEQEILLLSEEEKELAGKVEESQIELAQTKQDFEILIAEKTQQKLELSKRHKELEFKLSKLTEYVKKTASILLDLDLISQAEVETLLGQQRATKRARGHDFQEVFEGSEKSAVSYIQAFMYNKDILYRRYVLEDFFALVRTHDLIILAGDSGSGKTNLVKSFAESVGGKAIIIPVKPNWTSAEDLLGYYNPLEQKYLTTPFVEALFEAKNNPEIPYFICLDEMNLARVEYYFADFLSLLEERNYSPEISLYSDSESDNLLSEARNFLALIEDSKTKLEKSDLVSFLDLMRDEEVNAKLHELCGFREGDSLLKYHARLRKMFQSYLSTPAKLVLPGNVRIIGAINVDETTHYLSPKILDRAHLVRFLSPLLTDWDEIEEQIETFDLDISLPINFTPNDLGAREPYPEFDREDPLVAKLLHLTREYLDRLGVEFGMRTIRQARHYQRLLKVFEVSDEEVLNNIILHKVLPKLMFDGDKPIEQGLQKKDLLQSLKEYLQDEISTIDDSAMHSCIKELDRVIRNAENNDWVVNYWSR